MAFCVQCIKHTNWEDFLVALHEVWEETAVHIKAHDWRLYNVLVTALTKQIKKHPGLSHFAFWTSIQYKKTMEKANLLCDYLHCQISCSLFTSFQLLSCAAVDWQTSPALPKEAPLYGAGSCLTKKFSVVDYYWSNQISNGRSIAPRDWVLVLSVWWGNGLSNWSCGGM